MRKLIQSAHTMYSVTEMFVTSSSDGMSESGSFDSLTQALKHVQSDLFYNRKD